MRTGSDDGLLQAELRARVSNARGPWDEAVWRLQLGEPEEGLAIIRRSLPELLPLATESRHVADLALLAGESDMAARAAAAAIPGVTATYVAGSREYRATMLSLIVGDDEQAHRQLAELERFVSTHDRMRGGEPASLAQIPGGLVARQAGSLSAGIEALLAWHLRRTRSPSDVFNDSSGVVALDAIVALVLGNRVGLTVEVSPAYRAATLPLLAHLLEFEGRPLPRGTRLEIVTDLVAGPWLRALDVPIADPASGLTRARTPTRVPARIAAPSAAEEAIARQRVERRSRSAGHPWQKASWALMLGDVEGARAYLRSAAADARGRWLDSMPRTGGPMRWFQKDQILPNQNIVREHFELAIVLGDEAGLRETGVHLRAWLRTQEGRGWPVYGHAHGYIDLVCDLLSDDGSRPGKAEVDQVMGGPSNARVAAIGLANRDSDLVREGIDGVLAEHAKTLERKSSPPPPVSQPAVLLAVAASRLGVPVEVDPRYESWPVSVDGSRVATDLLARALWRGEGG